MIHTLSCLPISLMLIFFGSSGCRTSVQSSPTIEIVTIEKVFQLLPERMLDNVFEASPGIQTAGVNGILQGENPSWSLNSTADLLEIQQTDDETPLYYTLLRLQSDLFLLLQRMESHCCSSGRWFVVQYQNGRLKDRSADYLPEIEWADFFPEQSLNGIPPLPMENVIYPFYFNPKPDQKAVEISVVANFIELEYSEKVSGPLLANIPEQPLIYRWENGRMEPGKIEK